MSLMLQEKTKLTKGEKTKHRILESTISVMAFEGLKGTTHRAIAAHANTQLSLTTYYFKDIQQLIKQAFKLNVDKTKSYIDEQFNELFELVNGYSKVQLKKVAIRLEVCEQLVGILTRIFCKNTITHFESIIVEQQLLTEACINVEFSPLSYAQQQLILQPLHKLCHRFSTPSADNNAEIAAIIFTQLRHRIVRESATVESDKSLIDIIHNLAAIITHTKLK